MVEALFELLFEFFGELILQVGFEALGGAFKLGWQRLTGRDKGTTAFREVSWSVVTGLVCGGLTVLIFPVLTIRAPSLQILNLVVAPVVAGVLVERVRAWRESRPEFSLPVFGYAATFGLAFALTRWLFGH
jgi:O-antigen/teichoic acid export membrane protein